MRDPGERRSLVLGLGLDLGSGLGMGEEGRNREGFFDLLELVVECL